MVWQGRPAIGLFTGLLQKHFTQGDRMYVQHFVTATCQMNSNRINLSSTTTNMHGIGRTDSLTNFDLKKRSPTENEV